MNVIRTIGHVSLGLLLSAVAACQAPDPAVQAPAEKPPRPALQTFAYDCDATGYVVVDYRRTENAAWLFLPGKTKKLQSIRSASGTKYGENEVTFWSKGREATLESGENSERCVENRRASIIEDAKLRGVDFRGTGNEPGWVLELGPDGILLVVNYGEHSYRFPAVAPESDADARTSVYRSAQDGDRLSVWLTASQCQDSMADLRFQTTVRIELNQQTYQGCGQALH